MVSKKLAHDMQLSVAEGGLATAMGALFSGVFLTGFACTLGASRLQIGILFALPSLCGVAQLGGSYLLERWQNSRSLCVWSTLLARVLFLPVILIPVLFSHWSPASQVWSLVAVLSAAHLLGSVGGVAWLAWIRVLIPAAVRVPFFGKRNLVNVGLSLLVCTGGGFLVDLWGTTPEARMQGFAIVFALAMTCGLISSLILMFISAGETPVATHPPQHDFHQLVKAPLCEPNFRRLLLFYTIWTLAVNVAAPFVPVFLLQKLGLPFWYVMLLGTLGSVAGLAANNLWTRLAHRFGMKPMVMIATAGEALFPLLLLFASPGQGWMLLLAHLAGIFNTPLLIGPDSFILKLSPDRQASSYMAVFRAFVGPATAIAAIAGGYLAGSWSTSEIDSGPLQYGGLKIIFLLSFLGRVGSLILLHRVTEPGAESVGHIFRVLRRSWKWAPARPATAGLAAMTRLG